MKKSILKAFDDLKLEHTSMLVYYKTQANQSYNNNNLSINKIPDLPENRIKEVIRFRKL